MIGEITSLPEANGGISAPEHKQMQQSNRDAAVRMTSFVAGIINQESPFETREPGHLTGRSRERRDD